MTFGLLIQNLTGKSYTVVLSCMYLVVSIMNVCKHKCSLRIRSVHGLVSFASLK